jgi:hypothetical protein
MNGPSINEHDLSLLENEIVFTSNYFFQSNLCEVVKPNFHCWLDSEFLLGDGAKALKKELYERMPDTKFLLNIKGYSKEDNSSFYYTYNKHIPSLYGIKTNLAGFCSGYSTVALYAIGCAIYMGFKEIYVLGLDFPPGVFRHFDDKLGETEDPNKKEKKEDVCGNYWWYTKAQYESYALRRHAEKQGVKIVNLNKNSCIRAFQFGEYEKVITREE